MVYGDVGKGTGKEGTRWTGEGGERTKRHLPERRGEGTALLSSGKEGKGGGGFHKLRQAASHSERGGCEITWLPCRLRAMDGTVGG